MKHLRAIALLVALATLASGCGATGLTFAGVIKAAGVAATTACRIVLRDELAAVERADTEPPVEPVNSPISSDGSGGEVDGE